MYLQRLEIQGFKSFANKTALEYPNPEKGQSIAAIVGPNGSGKSCMADSIRWVLGEQSLKLLRGKKSTDVIFSGSEKRARSGFAEVVLHLDNSDKKAPIDYTELAIGRRLYQNGENEYFLNKNKARLGDILLLLAQANFGQRAYSVIGQGMVDAVLAQSPRERKDFFDEAAGVKQFQLKRHTSVNKLKLAEENLRQVEVLLNEVRPRLRTLSRHVNKLEQFDELKGRLHSLEHAYYGTLWHRLQKDYLAQKKQVAELETKLSALNAEIAALQKKFEQKETKSTASSELLALQTKYTELINRKNTLREKEFSSREKIAAFRYQAQTAKKEMPCAVISAELDKIITDYEGLVESVGEDTDWKALKKYLEKLLSSISDLSKRIKNPAGNIKIPAELEKAVLDAAKNIKDIDENVRALQTEMGKLNEKEKNEQTEFFTVQKNWRDKIEEKNFTLREANDLKIGLARIETRKESLEVEMEAHLKERKQTILAGPPSFVETSDGKPQETADPSAMEGEIQQLRYQLELIGGIDPETLKEYKETKERYDFLEGQSTDLANAMTQLRQLILEIDGQIGEQFDAAFKKINTEFGKFFSVLFDGGKARLEIIEMETHFSSPLPLSEGEAGGGGEAEQEEPEETEETIDDARGIEIIANPPGKKVKAVNMLSGGEKALVSIALICAIIANNPSPFVVLDEVDAALDESNSLRFAEIIKQLAHKTQFILITHNRATMNTSDVLYGVSMGDDGVSKLLSLKLEEAEELVNR